MDARSLMQALNFPVHPGTEDFPMVVTFDKVATNGKRYGLNPGEVVWQLAAFHQIL